MKRLFFFLLFLTVFSKVNATPSISGFTIYNQFLQNGALKVYNNAKSVFFASVSCSRQYTGSPATLEDVNIQIRLIVRNNGQDTDISFDNGISTIKTLTNGDFVAGNTPSPFSNSVMIQGELPVNLNSGRVYVQIRYMQNGVWSGWTSSNMNYGTVDVTINYGGMPDGLQQYARENGLFPSSMPMTLIYPSDTNPVLTVGSSIYSPNNVYRLTLQTDGNVVLYKNVNGSEQPLWSTRTQNSQPKPQSLFFQSDGNLVLYLGTAMNSGSIWASERYNRAGFNTVTSANAFYALQDDGNFVFYWRYASNGQNMSWVLASTATTNGLSPHSGNLHP